jgi:hypothetical protein
MRDDAVVLALFPSTGKSDADGDLGWCFGDGVASTNEAVMPRWSASALQRRTQNTNTADKNRAIRVRAKTRHT